MAKQSTSKPRVAARYVTAWRKVTPDDLDSWAGAQSFKRGKTYQRQNHVKELCVSPDGKLLAWVQGNQRYATRVELDLKKRAATERLSSQCSCPVGDSCKHAVAVVLEYLGSMDKINQGELASDTDPRWQVLSEEEGSIFVATVGSGKGRSTGRSGRAKLPKVSDDDIEQYLQNESHEELVSLLMTVIDRDPVFRKTLIDQCLLEQDNPDLLLQEAHAEMIALTKREAWWNSWKHIGNLPDYSSLKLRMETLLGYGYADQLLKLGEQLRRRGTSQVERSNDEGMTCSEIADCLKTVAQALLQSSLSDEDKLCLAIDWLLEDSYSMCDDFEPITRRRWKKSVWSNVADRLLAKFETERPGSELNKPGQSSEGSQWSRKYRREQRSDWIIHALDAAGRCDEATELCVREASESDAFERAIRRLIADKQFERAESLTREGLISTTPTHHGTIHRLQDLLCELAILKKDWMLPAAIAAERFFDSPDASRYRALLKSAKRAECESVIKRVADHFLETGDRLGQLPSSEGGQQLGVAWPLPPPPKTQDRPAARRDSKPNGPYYSVLIDLAIEDDRVDDVLRWYDARCEAVRATQASRYGRVSVASERVAKALSRKYPERAIEIYLQLADEVAAETNVKSYPEAGRLLKQIPALLQRSDRLNDWPKLIEQFREKHRRKIRLMDVVDRVEKEVKSGRS